MSYFNRTPGSKLLFAVLVAALLAIPLFTVYLLVYNRETQSQTAQASIVQGWGGAQQVTAPVLVIPYQSVGETTVTENGQPVTHQAVVWHELRIAPDLADLSTRLDPQRRHRSIYDAVVYQAMLKGRVRYSLPDDLQRRGIATDSLAFGRAELRFGVSDPSGLVGAPPSIVVDGQRLSAEPGNGAPAVQGKGFHAWFDASALAQHAITASFDYAVRGSESLALVPQGGDTRWSLSSTWANPSFQGEFLPIGHKVTDSGFDAVWRVGNLALGSTTASTDSDDVAAAPPLATVDLVTPVDLYSEVDRSVKYGFLFIGFTFLMFLMFDVIGGVAVSAVEYLLVGAGLVLFFVMLLAFAEVIGFLAAYVVAAGAIVGLLTSYSAAVLASWQRASWIAGMLAALYAVLYVLLSLEDYSLLIGSLLLFAALAAVMFLTRRVDWSGMQAAEA